MMLFQLLTLVCLLLLWQVLGRHSDSSHLAFSLRRTIALILSTLLLLALLNMFLKKPALASELEVSEHLEVESETEMLTIQELYLFTKCFKVRLDPVAKVECETEQPPCTTQFGTLKLKISWC